MPFSNLAYLYDHLPARFRRDDEDLFLKRFLSYFGEELDKFDYDLDTFHQRIAPETATEEFIDWWLYALFGWGWFPEWFTLDRKRAFYANVTRLYARRGTKRGIEEFLLAFGIRAHVTNEPQYWGEFAWGEEQAWTMTGPLGMVVEVSPLEAGLYQDLSFWGEFAWGDSDAFIVPAETLRNVDVEALLRFQQPLGQVMMVADKNV